MSGVLALMSEIERKYQLKFVPGDVQNLPTSFIEQGYLINGEDELRLRKVQEPEGLWAFYLTVKSSGDLERAEWEKLIPRWVFEALWAHVTHSLRKMRMTLPSGTPGLKYSVDTYQDQLDGLIILECEYPSISMAEEYLALNPVWVRSNSREVTFDSRYKNKNLVTATEAEIAELLRW